MFSHLNEVKSKKILFVKLGLLKCQCITHTHICGIKKLNYISPEKKHGSTETSKIKYKSHHRKITTGVFLNCSVAEKVLYKHIIQ